MRCGASGARRPSRSSVSARCAPRLVPATAWISSMITARRLLNIARPRTLVSRMCSDSGVVIRMCGVLRSIRARSDVRRVAGAHGDADLGERLARRPRSASFSCASGVSRLRCTSLLSALSGDTYSRCTALASGAALPVDDERVQLPQERRERLARAGRREDQRVVAVRDGRPAGALRRGGLAERLGEPAAHDRVERRERIAIVSHATARARACSVHREAVEQPRAAGRDEVLLAAAARPCAEFHDVGSCRRPAGRGGP